MSVEMIETKVEANPVQNAVVNPDAAFTPTKSEAVMERVSIPVDDDSSGAHLEMQGYIDCTFGVICSYLVGAISFLWMIIFIVIDYG